MGLNTYDRGLKAGTVIAQINTNDKHLCYDSRQVYQHFIRMGTSVHNFTSGKGILGRFLDLCLEVPKYFTSGKVISSFSFTIGKVFSCFFLKEK